MDTLTSLNVFCQVAKHQSFTKAADALDMSVAMASKHVRHLEVHVGARLLHRNSRNVRLTEAGERYYHQALFALETLDEARNDAHEGRQNPTGTLKVSMPAWFANDMVSGWLSEYQERYADVRLDLSVTNRKVDLVAEGFDLALRVEDTPKPSLISRPLAVVNFLMVASPEYLSQYGTPHTIEELQQHHFIYSNYTKQTTIDLFNHHTESHEILTITPYVQSDDTLMNFRLACAGMGVAYLPSWLVSKEVKKGVLVQLLPEHKTMSLSVQAVYTDRAFLSAKVRTFIDFLVEKCQQAPSLSQKTML